MTALERLKLIKAGRGAPPADLSSVLSGSLSRGARNFGRRKAGQEGSLRTDKTDKRGSDSLLGAGKSLHASPVAPRKIRELVEPGTDKTDKSLPLPDLDALRLTYGDTRGIEAKRKVVAAWVAAAGGRIEGGTLLLPLELPNTLTLATLKTYARCLGLVVVTEPPEGWYVEDALRRARNALSPETLADPAEVTMRGELR